MTVSNQARDPSDPSSINTSGSQDRERGDSRDGTTRENGELLIRGPQVMKGYLNAPDKTAECLDADGCSQRVTSLERMEDGYLYEWTD